MKRKWIGEAWWDVRSPRDPVQKAKVRFLLINNLPGYSLGMHMDYLMSFVCEVPNWLGFETHGDPKTPLSGLVHGLTTPKNLYPTWRKLTLLLRIKEKKRPSSLKKKVKTEASLWNGNSFWLFGAIYLSVENSIKVMRELGSKESGPKAMLEELPPQAILRYSKPISQTPNTSCS